MSSYSLWNTKLLVDVRNVENAMVNDNSRPIWMKIMVGTFTDMLIHSDDFNKSRVKPV